jgi:hypothetical protein
VQNLFRNFPWFGGLLLGILLTLVLRPASPILLAPAADNKVSAAYTRNGFGNVIMAPERRRRYSSCYEEFVKLRKAQLDAAKKGSDVAKDAAALKPKTELEIASADKTDSRNQQGLHPEERTEGSLVYVFHVKENGELIDYELANDGLRDKHFSTCIEKAFENIRFNPPPLGINRYIAYEMTFKTEETLKREREERGNQAPYTLVPTPGGIEPTPMEAKPADQSPGAE